jgi:frataxin-like iron-binding protein CyaY
MSTKNLTNNNPRQNMSDLVQAMLAQADYMRKIADDIESNICPYATDYCFQRGRLLCLREQAANIEDIVAKAKNRKPNQRNLVLDTESGFVFDQKQGEWLSTAEEVFTAAVRDSEGCL